MKRAELRLCHLFSSVVPMVRKDFLRPALPDLG